MGKMKQLLIDILENDEIDALLMRVETTTPHIFELLFGDELSNGEKQTFLRNFTRDEVLIGLTTTYLELKETINKDLTTLV